MKRTVIFMALVMNFGCANQQPVASMEEKEVPTSFKKVEAIELSDTIRVVEVIDDFDAKLPDKSQYSNCLEFLALLKEMKLSIKEFSDDYVLAQIQTDLTSGVMFPSDSCASAEAKALAKELMKP